MRLAAISLAALLPCAAFAQGIGSAVETCSDPMSTGPEKIEVLTAYGWRAIAEPSEAQLTTIGLSFAPFFGGEQPLTELAGLAARVSDGMGARIADGRFTLYGGGDGALLMFRTAVTETGLEGVSCFLAGPATAEIDGQWARVAQPNYSTVLESDFAVWEGSVFNARDEIAYTELSVLARLPETYSPLPHIYRYERIEEATE